ncbi:MFS general substrate transporter [Artomyces pyxidatus]|uniref:MFS general substrate transporter n=1 Tax=Artomyces pyxidatus TaxID=48021 RepID=A0ACB8SS50_9AGAM|nr:MFS general substrate transporter [Artomyces pyxidatus]
MAEPGPSLFGLSRLTTLVSSLVVALSSGTNYVVSAYAPQLGSRLHLTHTQLNFIALGGNIGVYTSGPFWGKLVDARGPRPLLVGAFVFLLSGYLGIRSLYDAGLDDGERLSQLHIGLLILCSFFTGLGGNAGLASAINSTAKSFPDRARAIVVGIVMSGFGLSAFFFSSISHLLFPGNTSGFLLVLALGTALPMILGFFFVRPVPLSPADASYAVEQGEYEPLSAADPTSFENPNTSHTHLIPSSDDEGDEDSLAPSFPDPPRPRRHSDLSRKHLHDSVELSPSASLIGFQHRSRSRSMSMVRAPNPVPKLEKIVEGRGVDITAWDLCKSGDFWIMCCVNMLLSGTGLMYINNVGSIAQALFAKGNPAYDEVEASVWQAAQVSTVSLMNFSGRILIGFTADFVKSRLQRPRSYCLTLVAGLFILSQAIMLSVEDVQSLWLASALLGLAYGSLFGVMPTISIEWFGLSHFSENWGYISISPVVGGNLFSLVFGHNLDSHDAPGASEVARADAGLPSSHQCIEGRECYVASLYVTLFACFIALGLAIWAGQRDWKDRRDRVLRGDHMEEVIWEGGGEAAGTEN